MSKMLHNFKLPTNVKWDVPLFFFFGKIVRAKERPDLRNMGGCANEKSIQCIVNKIYIFLKVLLNTSGTDNALIYI